MTESWLPQKSWRQEQQLGPEGDTGAGGLTRKNPGDLHNATYEIWIFDVTEIINFFILNEPLNVRTI